MGSVDSSEVRVGEVTASEEWTLLGAFWAVGTTSSPRRCSVLEEHAEMEDYLCVDPDEDDYCPRKQEYVQPATVDEAEEERQRVLHLQIMQLEKAIAARKESAAQVVKAGEIVYAFHMGGWHPAKIDAILEPNACRRCVAYRVLWEDSNGIIEAATKTGEEIRRVFACESPAEVMAHYQAVLSDLQQEKGRTVAQDMSHNITPSIILSDSFWKCQGLPPHCQSGYAYQAKLPAGRSKSSSLCGVSKTTGETRSSTTQTPSPKSSIDTQDSGDKSRARFSSLNIADIATNIADIAIVAPPEEAEEEEELARGQAPKFLSMFDLFVGIVPEQF